MKQIILFLFLSVQFLTAQQQKPFEQSLFIHGRGLHKKYMVGNQQTDKFNFLNALRQDPKASIPFEQYRKKRAISAYSYALGGVGYVTTMFFALKTINGSIKTETKAEQIRTYMPLMLGCVFFINGKLFDMSAKKKLQKSINQFNTF